MTIRQMEAGDLDAILTLQREWEAENITYGLVAGNHEQVIDAMNPYCLVAEEEHKAIGYLMAEAHSDSEFCIFPAGAAYLEICDLYVTMAYRSQGIGEKMLMHCERLARDHGIAHFLVSSATKDADAVRRFYTRNDYQIWTTTFYKENETK